MVGCVSLVARAAADRLPDLATARNERTKVQSITSVIQKRIATIEIYAIFFAKQAPQYPRQGFTTLT
jgi:hypothetical protein